MPCACMPVYGALLSYRVCVYNMELSTAGAINDFHKLHRTTTELGEPGLNMHTYVTLQVFNGTHIQLCCYYRMQYFTESMLEASTVIVSVQ